MAPGWLRTGLLVIVAMVAFGDVLDYGYIWDDHLLVELSIADVIENLRGSLHFRPIWYLSYSISGAMVESAVFEHAVNLGLFLLAVILAHRVAELFLDSSWRAFAVTLVWILLPWNAYPVTWIAQRNDLLIYVFGLSALIALYRERYVTSAVLMTLAVLSKPTIAFLPLFFFWKARTASRNGIAILLLALVVSYWSVALLNYAAYFSPDDHLEAAATALRVMRFPLHWAEHLVTLALPLPFILGVSHGGLYLAGVIGLLAGGLRRDAVAQMAQGRRPLDVLMIALLVSIPTMVTPELRICGLESLFWLTLVAMLLKMPRKIVAIPCFAALLTSYAIGLGATKTIFDTRSDPPGVEGPERSLYPNDYYAARRQFLLDLARRWKLIPTQNAPPPVGSTEREPNDRVMEDG